MAKVYAFLVDGFEPSEALVPIDFMRRAKFDVVVVSLMNRLLVSGSQGITAQADVVFSDVAGFDDADLIFLPGGPGTRSYLEHDELKTVVMKHYQAGKHLAAICAAPMVYGQYGILKGEKATCYPGFEQYLDGATFVRQSVAVSGQFVTAAGAGAAVYLGFKLVEVIGGKQLSEQIREQVNYQPES